MYVLKNCKTIQSLHRYESSLSQQHNRFFEYNQSMKLCWWFYTHRKNNYEKIYPAHCMITKRGSYISAAVIFPRQLYFRGSYISAAVIFPRQLYFCGSYISAAVIFPRQLYFRGSYISAAVIFPRHLYFRGSYISTAVIFLWKFKIKTYSNALFI